MKNENPGFTPSGRSTAEPFRAVENGTHQKAARQTAVNRVIRDHGENGGAKMPPAETRPAGTDRPAFSAYRNAPSGPAKPTPTERSTAEDR